MPSRCDRQIQSLTKRSPDPLLVSVIGDTLSNVSGAPAPGTYQTVVSQCLPRLCQAIASANDQWYICGHAIDLVSNLVQGAPDSGLGDGFVAQFAPALFGVLSAAEDRDVIQVGLTHLQKVFES